MEGQDLGQAWQKTMHEAHQHQERKHIPDFYAEAIRVAGEIQRDVYPEEFNKKEA